MNLLRALLCSLVLLASCQGPQFVFSATVQSNVQARPAVLGRYMPASMDGEPDLFVGWAEFAATFYVFTPDVGFPIYGPVTVDEGKVIVRSRKGNVDLELGLGDPLPLSAQRLFLPAEIQSWGLTFEAPLP